MTYFNSIFARGVDRHQKIWTPFSVHGMVVCGLYSQTHQQGIFVLKQISDRELMAIVARYDFAMARIETETHKALMEAAAKRYIHNIDMEYERLKNESDMRQVDGEILIMDVRIASIEADRKALETKKKEIEINKQELLNRINSIGQDIDEEGLRQAEADHQVSDTQFRIGKIDIDIQERDARIAEMGADERGLEAQVITKDAQIIGMDANLVTMDARIIGKDAQLVGMDAQSIVLDNKTQGTIIEGQVKDARAIVKDANIATEDARIITHDARISSGNAQLLVKDADIKVKSAHIKVKDAQSKTKDVELKLVQADEHRINAMIINEQSQQKKLELQQKEAEIQNSEHGIRREESLFELSQLDHEITKVGHKASEAEFAETSEQHKQVLVNVQTEDVKYQRHRTTNIDGPELEFEEVRVQHEGEKIDQDTKNTEHQKAEVEHRVRETVYHGKELDFQTEELGHNRTRTLAEKKKIDELDIPMEANRQAKIDHQAIIEGHNKQKIDHETEVVNKIDIPNVKIEEDNLLLQIEDAKLYAADVQLQIVQEALRLVEIDVDIDKENAQIAEYGLEKIDLDRFGKEANAERDIRIAELEAINKNKTTSITEYQRREAAATVEKNAIDSIPSSIDEIYENTRQVVVAEGAVERGRINADTDKIELQKTHSGIRKTTGRTQADAIYNSEIAISDAYKTYQQNRRSNMREFTDAVLSMLKDLEQVEINTQVSHLIGKVMKN